MNPSVLCSVLVVSALLDAVAPAEAQTPQSQSKRTYRNPIIDRIGPADPHVLKHNGRYYMYPTTDGKGYDVFVSDDLVHWATVAPFVPTKDGFEAVDPSPRSKGARFYMAR